MTDNRVFHERQTVYKGNWGGQRGAYDGSTVVSGSGLGHFGEAALKGHLFHGVATTQTIAAGNLVAASAGATTNTGLFNLSTDRVLLLQRVNIAIQSGTPTAGTVYHGIATGNTVASSITGMTAGRNAYAGGAASVAGYFLDSDAGVTLTGGAAPVTLGPIGGGLSAAAMTTGLVIPAIKEDVHGAIAIPPNCSYIPLFTGAGTTVIANFAYLWTEVPLFAV